MQTFNFQITDFLHLRLFEVFSCIIQNIHIWERKTVSADNSCIIRNIRIWHRKTVSAVNIFGWNVAWNLSYFLKKAEKLHFHSLSEHLFYIYLTNCRCRVGLPIIYIFDGQATSSSSSEEALEQCCGLVWPPYEVKSNFRISISYTN